MDSIGTVGRWTSVAVDSDQNILMSYYEATNADFKHGTSAEEIPEFGTAGAVVITIATVCIFVALWRMMAPTKKE